MKLLGLLHFIIDYVFTILGLGANRELGWRVWDRKEQRYCREQQPLNAKLEVLLLFNPWTQWLHDVRLFQTFYGWQKQRETQMKYDESSKRNIRPFVEFYNINMQEFSPADINVYSDFASFFIRQLAPSARPIHSPDDASSAIIPCDSRVVVFDTVCASRKLWIKGRDFTLANLTQNEKLGQIFADGAIASFRLSPQDYHRYHSPVTGVVSGSGSVPGNYFQVDPWAVTSGINVLGMNARRWLSLDTEEFGNVLFVAIGAVSVGTCRFHEHILKPGTQVRKGEELGYFTFGGSSVVVAFEPGRIAFDDDLRQMSLERTAVDVKVGMTLGTAVNRKR